MYYKLDTVKAAIQAKYAEPRRKRTALKKGQPRFKKYAQMCLEAATSKDKPQTPKTDKGKKHPRSTKVQVGVPGYVWVYSGIGRV